MSLEMRGKFWFYRKTINGHAIARSTKTADRKLAESIAACWEAEHIKSILIAGVKPINIGQWPMPQPDFGQAGLRDHSGHEQAGARDVATKS